MKKLTLSSAVAVLAFASSTSYAACVKTGYIERVNNAPGAGASTVYLRTGSTSNVFFSATTTDAKLIGAANAALTSRTWVQIIGNVAACPASGNIGGIASLVVAP